MRKYIKSRKTVERFIRLGKKFPAIGIKKESLDEFVGYSSSIKNSNFKNDALIMYEQDNINPLDYEKRRGITIIYDGHKNL